MAKRRIDSKMLDERGQPSGSIGVRELAKFADVSIGTVDRALNNRPGIKESTRLKILEIARLHGYSPNLSARALSFGKSSLRVGLCIPREIRYFYDQVYAGFMDEAQRNRHIGLETIYRPVRTLRSHLSGVIEALLELKVDAVVLTPGLATKVAPIISKAELRSNVRIVCVASDNTQSVRSTAVCVDPTMNGRVAAELMANLTPPRAKVAVMTGNLDTEDHAAKMRAFCSRFQQECPEGQVVATIEGHEEETATHEKTVRILRKHHDLAGIYVSTVNCLPVCKAVETAELGGKVRIISTDLFPELLPFFMRKTLSAAIYQNPFRQGQLALQLIVDHFMTGRPFPPIRYLSPIIALRSNLALFREMTDLLSGTRIAGESD